MAPNIKDGTDLNGVLFEDDASTPDMALARAPVQQADNYPRQLVWRNIILFAYLHIAAVYGGYLFLFSAKWQTDIFGKLINILSYYWCISLSCVNNVRHKAGDKPLLDKTFHCNESNTHFYFVTKIPCKDIIRETININYHTFIGFMYT